jgi:hypothetical protein
VTVRIDPELKGRLAEAAVKLDLSENDIVRHALRATVFCPLFKFSNETAAMLSPAGQDSELMPEARRTAALPTDKRK